MIIVTTEKVVEIVIIYGLAQYGCRNQPARQESTALCREKN